MSLVPSFASDQVRLKLQAKHRARSRAGILAAKQGGKQEAGAGPPNLLLHAIYLDDPLSVYQLGMRRNFTQSSS